MEARTAEELPRTGRPSSTVAGIGGAGSGWGAARAVRSLAERRPVSFWWGVSLALAGLTAAAWPTVPSYDPWSWIVWGREVTDPHISFFIGSGPSWKPLPFFFTLVYGALGGAAPTLWVITARTGGIAGLIGAWRLSAQLCRRAGLPWWSGAVAGVLAAVGIVLTAPSSGWTYYFFRGASEPLLIGVWVWAIDRLIARRHWQAFMLVVAEGLMRPEAWPFLVVYGVWLFWRMPSMRVWVVLGWIVQPVGWFVPPWISTGQPFLAATHAADYNGGLTAGLDRLKGVLDRGLGIQPLPLLALGVFAVLLALWLGRAALPRGRAALVHWFDSDPSEVPIVVGLAIATIAWWAIVVAMTEDGYPGLERFYLPAAAMICVLSGYGLVRGAALLGELVARGAAGRIAVACVAAVAVLAGSTHFVGARWAYAKQQEPLAAIAVKRIAELGTAVGVLGGSSRILPCRSSVVTINHSLQTALAWKLGTTLARVQTVMTKPGIAFVGPHDSIDGGEPLVLYHFQARVLARVGAWSLQQVWPVGEPLPACVGS
jgi:hypothetical protein